MEQLSYGDIQPALAKLADVPIVLVGGQAVNFWAEHYSSKVTELSAAAPFTSKDIDFCGDRRAVEDCARLLDGRSFLPELFDATPNSGKVVFRDAAGTDIEIDFIVQPYGLTAKDVMATSLPVVLDPSSSPEARFFVMHPERCMESRVHNYVGLNKRHPAALKQLRASVYCAREFMRELLVAGHIRPVLNLSKRIFDLCYYDLHGQQVLQLSGVDPFSAVFTSPELPAKFNEMSYPQMCARLEKRRRQKPAAP